MNNPPPFRFPTRIHRLAVAGTTIDLLAPSDPDDLLNELNAEQRLKTENVLPYWPIIWPSGLMLAEKILTDETVPPALAPGVTPRVIELGCGLGATGIAAGLRGWHVTFTDYDPEAIIFAGHNARRNGIPEERIRTLHMDWRACVPEKFPWILASDVLYERHLHPLLLGAVAALLAKGGVAWVSDPQRNCAEDFPMAALEAGFRVSTVPLMGKGFKGEPQAGNVYILSRPLPAPPRLERVAAAAVNGLCP